MTGGLRQFASELGVVGYVQQVGRKLLDDFVNNNQEDSPDSNAYLRWIAGKVAGTYTPPDSTSANGVAATVTVAVIPFLTGKGEIQAAKGARELAKAEVFAARTAPELKKIYGWGNGEAGVKAAREALDASAMTRIQGSVTRAEVEATRNLYREAEAAGRGGAVAPERAAYMEDILKLWK